MYRQTHTPDHGCTCKWSVKLEKNSHMRRSKQENKEAFSIVVAKGRNRWRRPADVAIRFVFQHLPEHNTACLVHSKILGTRQNTYENA